MTLLGIARLALCGCFLPLALASCARNAPPTAATDATAPGTVQLTSSSAPDNAGASLSLLEPATTTRAVPATPADAVAKIRDEGMNRSQVMQTLSYLTDVIGPRLTGSPNLRRANQWTRDKLSSWGLVNAQLEPWGPFGRGWSIRSFSAQVVEPYAIPLIAYPKAWSPGFDQPITAPVVYVNATTESDLAKYKGKLKGAIVLASPPRDVQARFEPLAVRVTDADLLKLANAEPGQASPPGLARASTAAERRAQFGLAPLDRAATRPIATQPATGPTTRGVASTNPADNSPASAARRLALARRLVTFLADEGAALVVSPSTQGDGGTLFVASASVPEPTTRRGPTTGGVASATPSRPPTSQPWAPDAPKILPQITVSIEHYNRLVRMIEQGEQLKMNVDLKVQFHADDLMAYNTIAEIPGTDLKDQVVMLGAHMDSWHSGTGATDNAAGCAAVMEAVRILKATGLKPRRTIRIALWTGEEQGLYGSKAYVEKHFGKFETPAPTTLPTSREATPSPEGARGTASPTRETPVGEGRGEGSSPRAQNVTRSGPRARPTSAPARKFLRGPEYDNLAAYFNLDNGTGKIRGVYMQGNEGVRPYFRRWLAPFVEDGAQTLTANSTGGTDHVPFDAIGLPGFQFIQDPLEYWTRTHHSNQDLYERIQPDDMKQAATIIATFIYNAATIDEKLPRRRVPGIDN